MNWDWEKLKQQQRQRGGGGPVPPNFEDLTEKFRRFRGFKFPAGKIILAAVVLLWALSGIYMVGPDEVGVVKRFGEFDRTVSSGLHYHIPYPVESVLTPNVFKVRRMELGFRSMNRDRRVPFQQGEGSNVPNEALMLTGDENIVSVPFIVQYQIKDAENYLFNVNEPEQAVYSAAEAAMREVIGKSKIDEALTAGKEEIQASTKMLMQEILDRYESGVNILAVQMQNVHPPAEVVDAFKDVASAREDRVRFINEAEAYYNDLIPKARGEAAVITNNAEAYRQTKVRKSEGDAARFTAVLKEYRKAPQITRERLSIETMEKVLSSPGMEKLILSDEALGKAVPYLPLDGAGRMRTQRSGSGSSQPAPTGQGQAKGGQQ